jgi:threonine aldolase
MNVRRLGGSSFHQGGIHAAAALVGFREMIPQLAEDNRRAATLADALRRVTGVTVDQGSAPTNMVIVAPDPGLMSAREFVDGLEMHGVLGYVSGENTVRFVTHRHIRDDDIVHAAEAAAAVAESFATPNSNRSAVGT